MLRGKPVLDVNDILKLATGLESAGHDRITSGEVGLHAVAVDVESARTVALTGMRTETEVWDALLASSRMPWAGGPPIELGGRRYLDGSMGSPVPVGEALAAGATHVLVLQTRPHGIPRTSSSRIGDRFIERHLRGLNPALVALYRARIDAYEDVVADIARRSAEPGDDAAVRARPAAAGRHALRRPARARQRRAGPGRGGRRPARHGRARLTTRWSGSPRSPR